MISVNRTCRFKINIVNRNKGEKRKYKFCLSYGRNSKVNQRVGQVVLERFQFIEKRIILTILVLICHLMGPNIKHVIIRNHKKAAQSISAHTQIIMQVVRV